MTPEQLRALADEATKGAAGDWARRTHAQRAASAHLIAIAPDLARLCAGQDDLLRRFSEWDVLNLVPGSGDDGPYWQGEIAKMRAKLAELEAR